MKDRPSYRKCAIDRVGLAFVALVATSSALPADDLTQPTAADPTVGTELESLAAVPSGTSPQSELIGTPSDTVLDATVEVQIRSDFNELRREILEDRMKLVDWWLSVMAVVLTLFAVVAPVVGFFGFRRFREIEIEARKGVEITNAAAEKAETKFEEAKMIVKDIESKRDEAKSVIQELTSESVDKDPNKVDKATQSANADPSPSLIDRAISAAIEMQRLGDIEGAVEKWRAIAEIAGGTYNELAARAWFSIGYLHAVESRFQDAIASFDEAILLKADYAEAFNNRGAAKSELGRHDEALADYEQAIRLKPDFAEAFNNRGNAKSGFGRHDEALADYEQAIRLKPDYAEAFYNRGNAKSGLGQPEEAISDYDEAIRLKADYAEAFNNRGAAKSGLGQHDEAIADYDKAICLKSDFATAFVNRAEALFHLMRHDEVRRDVETARKLAAATGDQSIVEKADELVKQFFGGEAN